MVTYQWWTVPKAEFRMTNYNKFHTSVSVTAFGVSTNSTSAQSVPGWVTVFGWFTLHHCKLYRIKKGKKRDIDRYLCLLLGISDSQCVIWTTARHKQQMKLDGKYSLESTDLRESEIRPPRQLTIALKLSYYLFIIAKLFKVKDGCLKFVYNIKIPGLRRSHRKTLTYLRRAYVSVYRYSLEVFPASRNLYRWRIN